MDVPRLFYTIPELAARWNCPENEIIHLAVSRKIFLAVNMTPFSPLPVSGWWNLIFPGEIATLLTGQQLFYASRFHDPSDENNRDSFIRFKKEDGMYGAFEFDRSDVVVLGKDVEKFEKESQDAPADDFIGYHKTMNLLEKKWQATEEELAAWIFWGPDKGGIAAYIGEYNPPQPFSFSYASTCRNYLPLLNKCCFRRDDIENFKPIERYITGKILIQRWGHVRGGPSSFIRARIIESRLLPLHPTFGSIQEVFEENVSDTDWPTLEEGLFLLEHIKLIEAEEGLFPPEEEPLIARDKRETLAHSLKGKVIPQEQQFRRLCIDELRKFARRWVGDSTEIPIKGIILYNYHSKGSPYFKRRDQDFRCPLYVVVFELPGLEWPETNIAETTWPPPPEQLKRSYLDGHPWQDFLEKLDNIPCQRFKENSHFLLYPGFEHVYDSTPANTWKQEWLFVAVDDLKSLPEYVDRNGPVQVLLPLTPVQKQPTTDQSAPVTFPSGAEVATPNPGGVMHLDRYSLHGYKDAAAHLEVTSKTIANYIKKGLPHLNPQKETNNTYWFDPEAIKAWHAKFKERKGLKLCDNLKK